MVCSIRTSTVVFAVGLVIGVAGEAEAQQQPEPGNDDGFSEPTETGDENDAVSERARKKKKKKDPKRLTAEAGEKPPEGYTEVSSNNRPLWIGGVTTFAAGCFVSVIAGGIADSIEDHEQGRYLWWGLLPIAGPIVTASSQEIEVGGKAVFVLLGATQATGLGMLIGGLATKKKTWLRDDVATYEPELVVGAGSAGVRVSF
jgi:hypothetical protein